jgi:hypothetical protein
VRHIDLFVAFVPLLFGCARAEETAAINAGAYGYCVNQAEQVGSDPIKECGTDRTAPQSFGSRYAYIHNQQQEQQAQRAASVPQRQADPCLQAWFAGLGAPGLPPGGALASANRTELVCKGYAVPPEPVPPTLVIVPAAPAPAPIPSFRQTVCSQIGRDVVCNTQ